MVDHNEHLIRLSEKLCPLLWQAPLTTLSPAEQVFVCVYELEREVNNGGFDKFLRNSPGRYATETIQALIAIGATAMAAIARDAVSLAFPDGHVPSDQEERAAVLDAAADTLNDELEALDERFYKYPDNLTELLFGYVLENKESIRRVEPA